MSKTDVFESKSQINKKSRQSKQKSLEIFRQELSVDDHLLSLSFVAARYATNLQTGYTSEEATKKLKEVGPNTLQLYASRKRIWIFLEYMFSGMAVLLWMGILLCCVSFTVTYFREPELLSDSYDQLYLALVLFLVIAITGLFGFYQEAQNQAIMEGFRKMIPKSAFVLRDGKIQQIESENVVPGDIVEISGGGCIPADVRIIEANSLKVDNSTITGESDPQPRQVDTAELNPLEAANLAFYGTNAIEGNGRGIVIATGDRTLMGHIAKLTSGLQSEISPIKKELKRFVKILSVIAVLIGLSCFTLSVTLDGNFFEGFIYLIAIIIANVPEGLLVTMTAALSLTARRMSKKNCLVKNLHAIETLGSTSVICSDKTGTLTQNRMTVSHIYCDHSIIDLLSEAYSKPTSVSFDLLTRVGILCSRATFIVDDNGGMTKEIKGDASEVAILRFVDGIVGDIMEYRNNFPKVFEIPFNSTNKYQLSVHSMFTDDKMVAVLKGAPEKIIEMCSSIVIDGHNEELDDQHGRRLKMALVELGCMGERVLGLADLELPSTNMNLFDNEGKEFPINGFRFLGFYAMIDPPKAGVSEAVSKCKSAGIKVVMVTGDHPITAMAIARKVGILSAENETRYDISLRRRISTNKVLPSEANACKAAVVTGSELREMNAYDLDMVIERYAEIVFARTSPQQKLIIVEAFQRAGYIVGVTGDGVNDSPALKKADIGIAMGISGSEVSKEAADMILLDDNFATIVSGIEEGRLIFDNLKKSIAYMLTSNVPELFPFLMFVIIKIPKALSTMAVLLIDVGTDLMPGISLAYEAPESDIMKRPPRNQKSDRLVGAKLLCFTNLNVGFTQACAGFSCYFYTMAEHGFLPSRLVGISKDWYSSTNDVLDSFNQEWTKDERMRLERMSVSSFFMAIVLTQISDCIICKTRRLSVIHQGLSNKIMNFGIALEIVVSIIVVYTPVNRLLGFESIHIYLIWPAIPFALYIFIFDELRKYIIRRNPGGWLEKETYF